jgi:hypothetical protein
MLKEGPREWEHLQYLRQTECENSNQIV